MGSSSLLLRLELLFRRLLALIVPTRGNHFVYSQRYWDARYRWGGNSGQGSRGEIAAGKTQFVNGFCRAHDVHALVELGSGDGYCAAQLSVERFLGLDISDAAIAAAEARCGAKGYVFANIAGKALGEIGALVEEKLGGLPAASLSMDVLLHLVEDEVFEAYLRTLFSISTRYVIIFSTDEDWARTQHVRHRHYSSYVMSQFPVRLLLADGDPQGAHFKVFEKL